jgi:hypothetical protein
MSTPPTDSFQLELRYHLCASEAPLPPQINSSVNYTVFCYVSCESIHKFAVGHGSHLIMKQELSRDTGVEKYLAVAVLSIQ